MLLGFEAVVQGRTNGQSLFGHFVHSSIEVWRQCKGEMAEDPAPNDMTRRCEPGIAKVLIPILNIAANEILGPNSEYTVAQIKQ